MYWPNLQSVALPVPEIIAIAVLVGVANPILGKGGRRGSGMVPFERALVTSYRLSIFLYLYAFRRYCRFCAPAQLSLAATSVSSALEVIFTMRCAI